MFYSTAYGLSFESDLRLPLFLPSETQSVADVVVHRADLEEMPPETFETTIMAVYASGDDLLVGLRGSGHFMISSGRSITYKPFPAKEPEAILPGLLGTGVGLLLHQRGVFTLHASAIEHDGSCVAFVAHKGTGKSTTCANLHRRGHRVVTDDILAVSVNDSGMPYVHPAYPQVKLRPDAVASLDTTPEDLPLIDPRYDRRRLDVSSSFASGPLPLKHLYILEDGDEIAFAPLSGVEAFMQMVTHSYVVRLLGRAAAGPAHFEHCNAVLRRVNVTRAVRPRGLQHLPAFLDALENHLETSSAPATET